MGCGASFVNSGVKNTQLHNPDIRINIIEATSILDFEDTDTGSACRQTPITAKKTPIKTCSNSAVVSLQKQQPDHSSSVVTTQQEFRMSNVSSSERPSSPIPTKKNILNRIHTDNNMNIDEVPLVL